MADLTVCLTHDVDRVHKSYQYITHDLLRFSLTKFKTLFTKENPYWAFDNIVALERQYNVRSTFFFLEELIPFNFFSPQSWEFSLGKYKFSDPQIAGVMRYLDREGWEIGLHGSYNSYQDLGLLKKEKRSLEKVLGKKVKGIRQHYLNLNIPETWIIQKKAGFDYDASFGQKDAIGFPNRTYHPFFNNESGMHILPLALMDGYLFAKAKNVQEAWEICVKLIDEAEKNRAVMVVLWHQRVFNKREFPGYKEIYEKIIVECKRRNGEFLLCGEIIETFFCHD